MRKIYVHALSRGDKNHSRRFNFRFNVGLQASYLKFTAVRSILGASEGVADAS